MGGKTQRFGFNTLGPGDSMAADGFKFSDADIVLMDRLLAAAAEGHHHSGVPAVDNTPTLPLSLHQLSTGGWFPSSKRYYYRFTLVDAAGNETVGSPVTFADTPVALLDPSPPGLLPFTSGGTLSPGNYSYVLSAYTTATTLETKASKSANITLPIATSIGQITLTLPPLGAATGFNIYRKTPNGARYLFLDSVTSAADYVDDGSVHEDCNRTLPGTNTTNNQGMITITYPGATPVIPLGYTWKIYRTLNPNNWANSLLKHVVEDGSLLIPPAPGVIVVSFSDLGSATGPGKPPVASQAIGNPSKVVLTDMAEVQGMLPPGGAVLSKQVTFTRPGILAAEAGRYTWLCPYDQAHITSVRAYLGVDSWPAATDVIVDVNKFGGATPTWSTIFTNQANRPRVAVGSQIGDAVVPDVISLVEGDLLSVDIDQAGGGATPVDFNLTVSVMMLVKDGSLTTPVF